MDQLDRTVFGGGIPAPVRGGELCMTVFDGGNAPKTIRLSSFRKNVVTFGRAEDNDLVFGSALVSQHHGRFRFDGMHWIIEDRAVYDRPSTNGLICSYRAITSRQITDGDIIRIDDGVETVPAGVLMVFSYSGEGSWKNYPTGSGRISIGRDERCTIVLPHASVSKLHAWITCENGAYYLTDNNSTNGIIVNNYPVRGRLRLQEKDVITIMNAKLIFTSAMIFCSSTKTGMTVDAQNVTILRGRKKTVTCNNVTLNIHPGELVSIVGGSGAGKSTILNCMCGYLKPAHGDVFINGVNLYRNLDYVKKMIGYVPQSDIVYDNLTLYDMLKYTAKLRLPKDTTSGEMEAAIDRAIDMVDLKEKKNSYIKALSGGQRKRASIAVELLSDPNLIFLDEPASGLDPGTEKSLMESLRKMADSGKTIILVTHSTLQLKLCDKVVFMGRGGNLCYAGGLDDALRFFKVPDVIGVYSLINENAPDWRERFNAIREPVLPGASRGHQEASANKRGRMQLGVLCSRNLKLVFNDRQRLFMMLIQAPILALLISFVADGQEFEQYEMTKSLLFALSCSSFWVGMLNSIQEICKERSIVRREYMANLSLTAYILSKLVIMGLMCLVQSLVLIGAFSALVGVPENGIITEPFTELLITTFLTSLSAAAMGLFVSALFTNADRAMTTAPILLMPQILFSGLLFKLDGFVETFSWFTICRWSMENYGTTADLNALPMRLQQEGLPIVHEAEDFFERTAEHMWTDWAILAGFVAVFMILSRIALRSLQKEG